ncbi:hypothetical protein C3F09_08515 [candidate division GN15 bacterium]|uniref:DUF4231 domain-containing protein n=1 Tax=candidate division GN15 bacterium TaxID=2072418 RepID=A0A855X4K2_9BACT|nr:MAG: hypothetical protein C3F09_08515 [candidate division GN15 bacterium]
MSETSEQDGPHKRAESFSIDRLRIAQEIRDYHHKALWEEEKHFTWFLSILLSSIALITTTDKIEPHPKIICAGVLSLLGVLISLLALRVVRNESRNFQVALHRFVACYNQVFPDIPLPMVGATEQAKSMPKRLQAALRGDVSTREAFQWVFRLFLLVFSLAICVMVWWILSE